MVRAMESDPGRGRAIRIELNASNYGEGIARSNPVAIDKPVSAPDVAIYKARFGKSEYIGCGRYSKAYFRARRPNIRGGQYQRGTG